MISITLVFCFVQLISWSSSEISADGSDELLLSFIVNRHGDRTPDPDEIILAEDPNLISKLSYPNGATGLTLEGKRRSYQLGKFLRKRYGNEEGGYKILSDLYLQDEISIRSTDLPRTKMTALAALAALYPPVKEQIWSSDLGMIWQPVPYTAVPSPDDYLRFTANCDRYKFLLHAHNNASKEEFKVYEDLAEELFNRTGYNFTDNPLLYATLHDLFASEAAIGISLPEWAVPIQSRINEAARLSYELFIKDDEMKRLATGVVLYNFLKASNEIIEGKPVNQRVRIHSSHDYNVGALMTVSRVKLATIPNYASMFALELHRNKLTGQYYVLPVYLEQAGKSAEAILKIDSCDATYCSFDRFQNLTEKYAMSEEQYFPACKM